MLGGRGGRLVRSPSSEMMSGILRFIYNRWTTETFEWQFPHYFFFISAPSNLGDWPIASQ